MPGLFEMYGSKAADGARSRYSAVRQLDAQPIIGRLDTRREPPAQLLVIKVRVQVGQDRAPRFEARDPGEGLGDAQVARMRLVAQRVDDPDFQRAEHGNAVLGQAGEVTG